MGVVLPDRLLSVVCVEAKAGSDTTSLHVSILVLSLVPRSLGTKLISAGRSHGLVGKTSFRV